MLGVFERGFMLGVPRFEAAFRHADVALLRVSVVDRGFIYYVWQQAFVIHRACLLVSAITASFRICLVCLALLQHLCVVSLYDAIHVHRA